MHQLLLIFFLLIPPRMNPIVATADNQVIDCQNKPLIGTGSGTGITVQGRSGVTIRNCIVHGFTLGLLVADSTRITVRDSDFSGNYVDDNSALDLGMSLVKGGVLFQNVTNSVIQRVVASNNVAAVQVIGGGYNVIRNNDLNGNRGWGIRLLSSPHNRVEENVANNNNRSCWSGVNSGCESAGLAMVNSDFTMVVGNTFNSSGDGIYQGNTPERASSNSWFYWNTLDDNSANGVEATFSHDNRFIGNELQRNNYGFWLGYASWGLVSGNFIANNHTSPYQADNSQNMNVANNNIPLQ
jgi:parallel beta-helix repeat protein